MNLLRKIVHTIGMNKELECILEPGKVISYRRQGNFELCYAGDDHAVIKHTTLSGKIMSLFIPERKGLAVSNGSYKVVGVSYESALQHWTHFKDKPRVTPVRVFITQSAPTVPKAERFNQELYDKYHTLLDGFNGFWKENFAESLQKDKDPYTF